MCNRAVYRGVVKRVCVCKVPQFAPVGVLLCVVRSSASVEMSSTILWTPRW